MPFFCRLFNRAYYVADTHYCYFHFLMTYLVVWKYPSMQKIATLTGHTFRVLYLAVSIYNFLILLAVTIVCFTPNQFISEHLFATAITRWIHHRDRCWR
jgi:hypothetical protein